MCGRRSPPLVKPLGFDVGLDPAGDLVADAPAFNSTLPQFVRGDPDQRDGDRDQRFGFGTEIGGIGLECRVDAGPVDHDHGSQPRDPGGLAPVGEVGEAICTDEEEQFIFGAFRMDGLEGLPRY